MFSLGASAFRKCLIATTLFSVAMFCGCGGDSRESAMRSANSSNLKRMCNIYYEYQSQHGWMGPKDEETLKTFISELTPETMELIGADPAKADELFVSERDGEPFQIRYKVRGSFAASDPVVFETKGVDGARMVGFTGSREKSVDSDAAYDQLWKGKVERKVNARNSREAIYNQ